MRKVQCCECGKHYDYEEDGFCPKCGAFNQPARTARIGPDGSVVRVDGVNESSHAGSFLHEELHEEMRQRRKSGLAGGVQRIPKARETTPTASDRKRSQKGSLGDLIARILGVIIALNVLRALFQMLGGFRLF